MDPTLSGKTYLLTGVTSGIGLAAGRQLAKRGANLIGVGRSPERCVGVEKELSALEGGGWVWVVKADLSLLEEVRRLARAVGERVSTLDGLINNAGTFTYQRTGTREGFETQWAVNHLAPFLLTNELLPFLSSAPFARVVTVSSASHYHTRLRWNDLQLGKFYNGLLAYKQTKLCNVLFTAELNRRLGAGSTIRAFAADPGLVFTDMGLKHNPPLVRWFWAWHRRRGITAQESARGVVYLAVDPSLQGSSDIYWKHGKAQAPNPHALDAEAGRRLWTISAQMCGSI